MTAVFGSRSFNELLLDATNLTEGVIAGMIPCFVDYNLGVHSGVNLRHGKVEL